MTNADKFRALFSGLMATELWAMPEDEFLTWLNSEATVDAISLGEEVWLDRLNIRTKEWRAEDGELMGVSFVITRKEAEDERPD